MSDTQLSPCTIGIMQGRLVPPVGNRVQAFPADCWEAEFGIAEQLGFDSLELTIETESWDIHPIRTDRGRARLRELSCDHGIALAGLCCDTIMECSLADPDPLVRARADEMLRDLLVNAAAVELPMLELPVMGEASLRNRECREQFIEAIGGALTLADELGIDILLESDLDSETFSDLMAEVGHPRLGINYDTGNSTYFGFEPDDELPRLMPHIRNIHIKDCTVADYSVPLGAGDTCFDRVFGCLKRGGYRGGFILQTARQDNDVSAAESSLAFTRDWVSSLH